MLVVFWLVAMCSLLLYVVIFVTARAFIFSFIWMRAEDRLSPYTQGVNKMYIIRNCPTGSLMD